MDSVRSRPVFAVPEGPGNLHEAVLERQLGGGDVEGLLAFVHVPVREPDGRPGQAAAP